MATMAVAKVALEEEEEQKKKKKKTFHQQSALKFKEETNEMLHFEHTSVWYCNFCICRSEAPS
jgi:hypothetical protein